jgi:hypothetical protein
VLRQYREVRTVSAEFNVIALIKGDERYVYVYDDESRAALLEAFQEHAADQRLSINWFDAAVLSQKAQEQAAAQAPEPTPAARF